MSFSETQIAGVWIHQSERFTDSRGGFHEQFKQSMIQSELGREFVVEQVNQSVSVAGTVRGIHWTDSPQGQAKYVWCTNGTIWDVFVDLRKNSKTYGKWGAETLTEANGKSVLISEGIGHAFLALSEGAIVNYLCTSEYNPLADRTIQPLDHTLKIPFAEMASEHGVHSLVISPKDQSGEVFQSL